MCDSVKQWSLPDSNGRVTEALDTVASSSLAHSFPGFTIALLRCAELISTLEMKPHVLTWLRLAPRRARITRVMKRPSDEASAPPAGAVRMNSSPAGPAHTQIHCK